MGGGHGIGQSLVRRFETGAHSAAAFDGVGQGMPRSDENFLLAYRLARKRSILI
jgi:hypothetical protein